MRARRALALAPLALWAGCASPLKVGTRKGGEVVEASGSAPASEGDKAAAAASLEEARRQAVRGLLDLYMDPAARAAAAAALDEKIVAKAAAYVARIEVQEARVLSGTHTTRVLAQVDFLKLGKDLESLGLIKPDRIKGRPRLLLSLKESGTGAGKDVGRASDALRRALYERGYVAADYSDLIEKAHRKSGTLLEAREAAKAMKAELLVMGTAQAEPVTDERLEGYQPYRARVVLEAQAPGTGESLSSWTVEATALDVAASGSAAKALANAGELAAEKLRAWMASRYSERSEVYVTVSGVKDLSQARGLIAAMRGLPKAAAAALDAYRAPDLRVRVFVENVPADELTASLIRMKPWSFEVRSVEPDYNSIELELTGRRGAGD